MRSPEGAWGREERKRLEQSCTDMVHDALKPNWAAHRDNQIWPAVIHLADSACSGTAAVNHHEWRHCPHVRYIDIDIWTHIWPCILGITFMLDNSADKDSHPAPMLRKDCFFFTQTLRMWGMGGGVCSTSTFRVSRLEDCLNSNQDLSLI